MELLLTNLVRGGKARSVTVYLRIFGDGISEMLSDL